MKARATRYSEAELAWLEANCTLKMREYAARFTATFGRDVRATALAELRKRKRWRTGRSGRFEKGNTPPNKGKGSEYLRGRAAIIYVPVGTERIDKSGYVERKIKTGGSRAERWKLAHVIAWEAVNGPVPSGMALKCKSDRLNTDPSNWVLIPRAILPRLSGLRRGAHESYVAYASAPDELKPAIIAVAMLEDAARQARKQEAGHG